MSGRRWDLAIVGAGPAGSTAALAALAERPRARVLLMDRERFPRDKSCGDGIAPRLGAALTTGLLHNRLMPIEGS